MAEQLYGIAAEMAQLRGHERVFDLFSGIGTIGLTLAARAREVVGVEIVEAAVADAIENARRNDVLNARFYAGDIRLAMRDLVEEAGRPDVLVVDPPRAGLSQKVVRRILEAQPSRVVYVSCNPTTLAPTPPRWSRPATASPASARSTCSRRRRTSNASPCSSASSQAARREWGRIVAERAGEVLVRAAVERHAAVGGADLDALVGTRVEARAPVDDPVRARVQRRVAHVAGNGPAMSARKPAQHSPRRQRIEKNPGTWPVPSAPTRPMCRSTSGLTASIETVGAPSVTRPSTRSGRRTATTRASTPPRLWPTSVTRRPVRSASASTRCSRRRQYSSEQPTLARMPARRVQ